MNKNIYKYIGFFFLLFLGWFIINIYSTVFLKDISKKEVITFEVVEGQSVRALAQDLKEKGIISSDTWFVRYVSWKDIDRSIRVGTHTVEAPITIARVAKELLNRISREELEITLLPGWNIRDIAEYFDSEGMFEKKEVFELLGVPALDYRQENSYDNPTNQFDDIDIVSYKTEYVSFEGYLSPDTYRIYADATMEEIVEKLLRHRDAQFTEKIYADIAAQGRSVEEIMIMASLLEREVRGSVDKKKVSDLFWRRLDNGWLLQADSTVHYLTGKTGNVFTTPADRDTDSPWNTYKIIGFPLSPIAMPSFESIEAAVYPVKNDAWYFLTDMEGGVHYGRDLDEHNRNVQRYLR